ncbi:MAG TPA: hypothetical protein VIK50_03510 [Gemmatimonadaceae bacterium]
MDTSTMLHSVPAVHCGALDSMIEIPAESRVATVDGAVSIRAHAAKGA